MCVNGARLHHTICTQYIYVYICIIYTQTSKDLVNCKKLQKATNARPFALPVAYTFILNMYYIRLQTTKFIYIFVYILFCFLFVICFIQSAFEPRDFCKNLFKWWQSRIKLNNQQTYMISICGTLKSNCNVRVCHWFWNYWFPH